MQASVQRLFSVWFVVQQQQCFYSMSALIAKFCLQVTAVSHKQNINLPLNATSSLVSAEEMYKDSNSLGAAKRDVFFPFHGKLLHTLLGNVLLTVDLLCVLSVSFVAGCDSAG